MKNNEAIFVFPFAGGSSYSMRGLSEKFSQIDVIILEMPGRGKLSGEALLTKVDDIVDCMYKELKDLIGNYKKYYFFGHSMGTLVSYLMMHKLNNSQLPLPAHLFVSGRGGPSITDDSEAWYKLPSNLFREKLRDLGGCPEEVLNNKDLMDFFEPILKADFEAVETYEYTEAFPFKIPITCFYGTEDDATLDDINQWAKETTYPIRAIGFKGNHFFIFDKWQEIYEEINTVINQKENILN